MKDKEQTPRLERSRAQRVKEPKLRYEDIMKRLRNTVTAEIKACGGSHLVGTESS